MRPRCVATRAECDELRLKLEAEQRRFHQETMMAWVNINVSENNGLVEAQNIHLPRCAA